MAYPSYERDVEEQLADALPALTQAALKLTIQGLHGLLTSCPNPTHEKMMVWLWTLV